MGGATSSNHVHNRTKEYPASLDVFRYLLNKLVAAGGERWIHFDGPQKETWVEVANDLDDFLELNFSFPFKGNLEEVLANTKIVVPNDWRLIQFKPKRLGGFLAGHALYSVPKKSSDSLVSFVDDLFIKLFACAKDYPVSGYMI
ncbi:MAG TPA: hypothetical protein VKA67_00380 [Verrucomicrobiae bacterium]|nr:hypothetical protein [Verrucomicrobiae bacterium]